MTPWGSDRGRTFRTAGCGCRATCHRPLTTAHIGRARWARIRRGGAPLSTVRRPAPTPAAVYLPVPVRGDRRRRRDVSTARAPQPSGVAADHPRWPPTPTQWITSAGVSVSSGRGAPRPPRRADPSAEVLDGADGRRFAVGIRVPRDAGAAYRGDAILPGADAEVVSRCVRPVTDTESALPLILAVGRLARSFGRLALFAARCPSSCTVEPERLKGGCQ